MSRAFIKEDAQHDDVQVVPRAPLPDGARNLVTKRGLELLLAEEAELREALAAGGRSEGDDRLRLALESALDELLVRIASAEVAEPTAAPTGAAVPGGASASADAPSGAAGSDGEVKIQFGHTVALRPVGTGSAFSVRIVGVDEADPDADQISYLAPLAQALIGRRVGDAVPLGQSGREALIDSISESYP